MTPAPPDQSYGKRHAEPPFRRIFQRVQWFARPAASPCVGNFLAAGLVQKHPTSYACGGWQSESISQGSPHGSTGNPPTAACLVSIL